jgi:predicted ATP-dependent serine protease
MQDEFKFRYTCPKCENRIRISSGTCPKCGYIGQMEHRDIRLRGTNHLGVTVTVPPLKSNLEPSRNKDNTVGGNTAQYVCPRCGSPTATAHGRCPNNRSCGYFGKMEPNFSK